MIVSLIHIHFLLSLLSSGWRLGPICFGKLIDGICIQWENSCSGSGACRLYDNDIFRLKLLGYTALFEFLGLVFITLALIVAKVTKKFEKMETKGKNLVTVSLLNRAKGDKLEERTTTPI